MDFILEVFIFDPAAFYAGKPITWAFICIVLAWMAGLNIAVSDIDSLRHEIGIKDRVNIFGIAIRLAAQFATLSLVFGLISSFFNYTWWVGALILLASMAAASVAADGHRWADLKTEPGAVADPDMDARLRRIRDGKVFGQVLTWFAIVAIYWLKPSI